MKSFSKSVLALSVSAALTACGGGSTSGDVVQDVPKSKTYMGYVADGFLSGASVCYDANSNSACDPNENPVITSSDGAYSLTVPSGVSVDQLIAVVPPTAIDSDTGLEVGGKGYVLRAPVENYGFISPITTMLSSYVSAGLTKEDALLKIRQDIGLVKLDSASVLTDYINNYDGLDSAEVERLRKTAVVTATVLKERLAELYDSNGGVLDEDGFKQSMAIVENDVRLALSTIATSAANTDFSDLRSAGIFQEVKAGSDPTLFKDVVFSGVVSNDDPAPTLPVITNPVSTSGVVEFASECKPVVTNYSAAYYHYAFKEDNTLYTEMRNYYASNGVDALTLCQNGAAHVDTWAKAAYNYSSEALISSGDPTILTLNYSPNGSFYGRTSAAYTSVQKTGDYLCFGSGDGFIGFMGYVSHDTVNINVLDSAIYDKSSYGPLLQLGLLTKTSKEYVSNDIQFGNLSFCLKAIN